MKSTSINLTIKYMCVPDEWFDFLESVTWELSSLQSSKIKYFQSEKKYYFIFNRFSSLNYYTSQNNMDLKCLFHFDFDWKGFYGELYLVFNPSLIPILNQKKKIDFIQNSLLFHFYIKYFSFDKSKNLKNF